MDVSPSCELIRTAPGAFLFADSVRRPAGSPAFRPLAHFHPQAELVWFRRVAGEVRIDGRSHPLRDGQAVLLPPMQVHAFATGTGTRDWVLLQIDPALVDAGFRQGARNLFAGPAILTPAPETAARIDLLCDWLAGIAGSPDRMAEAERVLDLLFVLLANSAAASGGLPPAPATLSDPLQEVLATLHAAPDQAPSLAEAATRAHLSPSAFSRRFKARVGMGYAAYLQTHRLNLAARRLLAEPAQIAQVAYALGFASAAHFSTIFTRRFGLSPRDWRRRAGLPADPAQERESD